MHFSHSWQEWTCLYKQNLEKIVFLQIKITKRKPVFLNSEVEKFTEASENKFLQNASNWVSNDPCWSTEIRKVENRLKVKHVLDKKTDLSQKFGQHSNKNPFFGFKDMDMKTNGQYLEAFYSFVDTHIRIFWRKYIFTNVIFDFFPPKVNFA